MMLILVFNLNLKFAVPNRDNSASLKGDNDGTYLVGGAVEPE